MTYPVSEAGKIHRLTFCENGLHQAKSLWMNTMRRRKSLKEVKQKNYKSLFSRNKYEKINFLFVRTQN